MEKMIEKELSTSPKVQVGQKIIAWFKLIRVPNLFTLPGDIAFGVITAGGTMLSMVYLKAALILLGLYIFGLITNDIMDINIDKLERPERPLPSGLIHILTAKIVAMLILAAVLYGAYSMNHNFKITVIFLALLILMYNFYLKKHPILGPITVSACRVGGLVLGFYTVFPQVDSNILMLYLGSWVWFMYFLSVSLSAYYETDCEKSVKGVLLLFVVPLIWLSSAPLVSGSFTVVSIMKELNLSLIVALVSGLIFAVHILKNVIILTYFVKEGEDISRSIGDLIWNLIFLQVSACAFLGAPDAAFLILLLAVPGKLLAKKFYIS
jgi:4-hydroxybenzoate polyprenyltransferase